MKKVYKLAAVLGLGLAMGPWAVAQAPAAQTATAPVVAATIPLDQQPTKEQLAKLFEVMRLRQQLDGVMKMMPAMMQQQVQVQMKELLAKQSGAGSITPDQQAAITACQNKYMAKAMGMYTVD